MKTVNGILVCEHGINVKFCRACQESGAEISVAKSMWNRILSVLADGQWHTTRKLAEAAGLLAEENYADIGRCIRKMRDEEHSPVDSRLCEDGEKHRHEYRLLQADEADEFWRRHSERKSRQRACVAEALGNAAVADLRSEIEFLKQYAEELEKDNRVLLAENMALKSAVPVAA
jgi:hypothetical protein